MPRRYPDRRRRRPGRRPPVRYSGWHGPGRADGFTGPGFRQLYRWLLPGLGGPEINEVSRGIILAAGFCGAFLGPACFCWIGAILGLGGGIAAGGSFAESRRFHRR